MKHLFASMIVGMFFSVANGGGMVSSGGEILKDANNPWWVKNTETVKYCVRVDQAGVSASPEKIKFLISKAIEYWKTEFNRPVEFVKNASEFNHYFKILGVGAQMFVSGDCNQNTDLKFLIGRGSLGDYAKEIPKPKSTLAVAVRTDYDPILLKGKGFIHLASDRGADSYEGGEALVEAPWKHDILLYMALVHELGHVFGLPHLGEKYTQMSEQFLEVFLNKDFAKTYMDIDLGSFTPVAYYFSPADYSLICLDEEASSNLNRGLNLNLKSRCYHFVLNRLTKAIDLYTTDISLMNPERAGSINDLDLKADTSLAISLVLSLEQKVFDNPATTPYLYVPGPLFLGYKGDAMFVSSEFTKKSKPIFLNFQSSRLTIVAQMDTPKGERLKSLLDAPPNLSSVTALRYALGFFKNRSGKAFGPGSNSKSNSKSNSN